MPQMANITVKKADGTTDVVFTSMTPSSGDGVAAQWRANGSGASAAVRAVATCSSKFNGAKTARRVDLTFNYPQVETVGGVETVVNRLPFVLSVPIPLSATDAAISEAVAQATNFFASALIRDSLKAGYSPS